MPTFSEYRDSLIPGYGEVELSETIASMAELRDRYRREGDAESLRMAEKGRFAAIHLETLLHWLDLGSVADLIAADNEPGAGRGVAKSVGNLAVACSVLGVGVAR